MDEQQWDPREDDRLNHDKAPDDVDDVEGPTPDDASPDDWARLSKIPINTGTPPPEPPPLESEPSVPEPSVPEPSVPEPSVPEPSVPEPSVPEPSEPEPSEPDDDAPAFVTRPLADSIDDDLPGDELSMEDVASHDADELKLDLDEATPDAHPLPDQPTEAISPTDPSAPEMPDAGMPPPSLHVPPPEGPEETPPPKPAPKKKPERLASLDALRGFDMFWIIGGGAIVKGLLNVCKCPTSECINRQLSHVPWEGFAGWDLIMPLFLFLAGVSLPFAFGKRREAGSGTCGLLFRVFRRVVVLYILGMMVQGNLLTYHWEEFYLFSNTLQAIAAGYLVCALLLLFTGIKVQAVMFFVLLFGYWGVMSFVPFPGGETGDLKAGSNLAIYIDKLLLGGFKDKTTYTWILSSATFAATVLMGVLSGHWLRSKRSGLAKAGGLAGAGLICLGLGYLWGWEKIKPPIGFPVIKHLWTSSMVLVAGGYSLILLALFYLVIDVWRFKIWALGFRVIGANAIFAYVAWQLPGAKRAFHDAALVFLQGTHQYVGDWVNGVNAAGAFLILFVLLCWLYRKKIFIKV